MADRQQRGFSRRNVLAGSAATVASANFARADAQPAQRDAPQTNMAEGVTPLRSQQRFLELAAEAGNRATVAPVPEVPIAPMPRAARRSQREKGRKP